jgi:hypothetical protein
MEIINSVINLDKMLRNEDVHEYLDRVLSKYTFLSYISVCDEKIPNKFSKHHGNMIQCAGKYDLEKFDTHLTTKPEWDSENEDYPHIYQSGFYKNDNCVLFHLNVATCEDNGIDMIGLIDSDKNYVFVGCSGSHPFIITNAFSYCNSDGSGPDMYKELENSTHIKTLNVMAKYYDSFCDNRYH